MVRSTPRRAVNSPAAFLKVLTIPCMSIMGSLRGEGLGMREAGSAFGCERSVIIYSASFQSICIKRKVHQLTICNPQSAREARGKTLVVRHHDDRLAQFADQ